VLVSARVPHVKTVNSLMRLQLAGYYATKEQFSPEDMELYSLSGFQSTMQLAFNADLFDHLLEHCRQTSFPGLLSGVMDLIMEYSETTPDITFMAGYRDICYQIPGGEFTTIPASESDVEFLARKTCPADRSLELPDDGFNSGTSLLMVVPRSVVSQSKIDIKTNPNGKFRVILDERVHVYILESPERYRYSGSFEYTKACTGLNSEFKGESANMNNVLFEISEMSYVTFNANGLILFTSETPIVSCSAIEQPCFLDTDDKYYITDNGIDNNIAVIKRGPGTKIERYINAQLLLSNAD
jgi:hypothetical protein